MLIHTAGGARFFYVWCHFIHVYFSWVWGYYIIYFCMAIQLIYTMSVTGRGLKRSFWTCFQSFWFMSIKYVQFNSCSPFQHPPPPHPRFQYLPVRCAVTDLVVLLPVTCFRVRVVRGGVSILYNYYIRRLYDCNSVLNEYSFFRHYRWLFLM